MKYYIKHVYTKKQIDKAMDKFAKFTGTENWRGRYIIDASTAEVVCFRDEFICYYLKGVLNNEVH